MKTIYKYPLQITASQVIGLHVGAKILCVQVQNGMPELWALVDTSKYKVNITITIVGTGHPFPEADSHEYISTIQMNQGSLVFHVFREL